MHMTTALFSSLKMALLVSGTGSRSGIDPRTLSNRQSKVPKNTDGASLEKISLHHLPHCSNGARVLSATSDRD